MILNIRKKDFNSIYLSTCDCAIARALKRITNKPILVGGYSIDIGDQEFRFDGNIIQNTYRSPKAIKLELIGKKKLRRK